MKRIKLYSRKYGNKYVIVSDEDYERVAQYRWSLEKDTHTFYAMRNDKGKKVRMHRFLLNPKNTHQVDHINRNGLDNRRENIRIVTKRQNSVNRGKNHGSRRRYKGIHLNPKTNKWMAFVNYRHKRKYLGSFKTAREAAIVYNEAALKYYGPTASVNKIVDKK